MRVALLAAVLAVTACGGETCRRVRFTCSAANGNFWAATVDSCANGDHWFAWYEGACAACRGCQQTPVSGAEPDEHPGEGAVGVEGL